MASEVYSPTTAPNPKSSLFMVPSEHLDYKRFGLKATEVVLSFLAFILEEVVANCISCKALYFFEFVSCTAFLFTLLLLILLSTKLHTKVGISCWAKLDFIYTAAIAVLFLISSIIFAVNNTGSGLESSSVAFGFLAMAAFAVDVFFFVKTRGFPFKKDEQPVSRNGGPVTVETPEETDKLNSVSNGAD
ncbi:CKLF-like MARVEL transmembrane domain-containing protein 6 [Melanotaenia boesemani]|uniref:CKLF-like MARVEL transmembrane domain-containing protein 6 n=1 Tax=Melanotaenia boesemani TaxID=1250792 RepID=UPI001C0427DB|nr:CKLF-like MARVEL transmembrane domain-containing protein 6 [Melanotaenia boesemani]